MKKLQLVKLVNEKPYLKNNLQNGMHGIVVDENLNNISVLFFNPQNVGSYAVINVYVKDIVLEKENLPDKMKNEILFNLDSILSKAKNYLEPITIKEYDIVELLVEDTKYSKFGIHKGDRGCVMESRAVQNYIEVDFSGINSNGDFYGDCVAVKVEDLKVLK